MDEIELARALAYALSRLLDDETAFIARHADGGLNITIQSPHLKNTATVLLLYGSSIQAFRSDDLAP